MKDVRKQIAAALGVPVEAITEHINLQTIAAPATD